MANLIGQIKDFYLNPKIKRTNLPENYTKEQVEEYLKCSEDPVYFIEKYVKINSLDEGFIPFKLRGYQEDLIKQEELFANHNFNKYLDKLDDCNKLDKLTNNNSDLGFNIKLSQKDKKQLFLVKLPNATQKFITVRCLY